MPSTLRAAILVDSLVVGGAERVTQTLARRLHEFGVHVEVGCLRAPGPIGDALRREGVALASGLGPRRADPRHVLHVRRWLQGVGADVVLILDHSNALFFGRIAARSLGVPAVVAVHRTRRADGSPSLGRIDRLLLPWTTAVLAVSEGHARYLHDVEGVDAGRIRVVHNGVDPEHFAGASDPDRRRTARRALDLPDDAPVLGVVAALRPEKNHEALLDALARPELAAVHLVAVGDGPRREALEARSRELVVDARVRWTGWRDDVVDVLAAIDALVLPSHPNVETFPVCVLEAMAAARPAVATRVGSLDEMIEDGRTGWLVPAGDPDALAAAMVEVVTDAGERARRGEASRRVLRDRFDEKDMVEKVARILREACAA